MPHPRKRPEQRGAVSIGKRFPRAPRHVLFGTTYLQTPCEDCGLDVWFNAANTRAVCNACVPVASVADRGQNQTPVQPTRHGDKDDG